jgi:hypothetical protein
MWSTGDRVSFKASADTILEGVISRVWNKPATDPYVTVKSDDGRTFVRCSSTVREV